jgi:hypothetical protein
MNKNEGFLLEAYMVILNNVIPSFLTMLYSNAFRLPERVKLMSFMFSFLQHTTS